MIGNTNTKSTGLEPKTGLINDAHGAGRLKECEENLKKLGLSQSQIEALGDTIDVIEDQILDKYFSQFYE